MMPINCEVVNTFVHFARQADTVVARSMETVFSCTVALKGFG